MLKRWMHFLLLSALLLNSAHAFFFDCDNNHYIIEFVQEIDHPVQKGDICDGHFVYHMPLLFSSSVTIDFPKQDTKIDSILFCHAQHHSFSLLKPPKSS
ncbi:hypothetical protein [Nitratiruptor sp. SB155-2]|uniref:hypothetical protein n=1 Tax=Nitratiruptor sp. (strain SB155-2) TaxID=387092 RepID=UPI0002F6DDC1|nr:hypothetical protein [Nitratiruptor sp. SB155-2]